MPVLVLALALLAGGCKRTLAPELPDVWRYELDASLGGTVQAVARGATGRLWIAVEDDRPGASVRAQFAVRDGEEGAFTFASRGDLPPGQITFLGVVDGSREWLLAYVHGRGFYRSWANSGSWAPVELRSAAIELLRPGARPIPTDLSVSDDGVAWLSTLGGVFFSTDEGATWQSANLATAGQTNLVYTGIATRGDTVVAVASLPESLIPGAFEGILGGRVFVSENNGLTWSLADDGFPGLHPSSVAIADDGTLYVGTMDEGVVRGRSGAWTPLAGPSDVRDLTWARGGLDVASATRGLWRLEDEVWSTAGSGPALAALGESGVTRAGEVHSLVQGEPEAAPPQRDGQVHVALSFHVNYYHSYRGDTNDEDGFGRDIRIIRIIQDMLDDRPSVRADWDLENAFSTDDWMASYSPDILDRIRARVDDGRDDVRLMSWNNGAMASSNRAEFDEAIQRAITSNEDLFGRVEPGVQPQENMISPDHLEWYRDLGVEWVTLFYSANGFTGPRNDLRLDGAAAHNPFILRDAVTQGSMTGVPVYHHADLLDHGGLKGWVKQLNAAYDGDTLLVIHFDADGDSWENFGAELDAIADLPFVTYTTIGTYLDQHAPMADVVLVGDVADGVGDGFSSWAEKHVNHEIWTIIEESRRVTAAARRIGVGHAPTQNAADAALEPRLLALSTTHFGLATPALHPDREVSARYLANDALAAARNALALAEATRPIQPFEFDVVNPRDASATTLIPFELRLPTGVWEGEEGLAIDRSGTPVPMRAFFDRTDGDEDVIDIILRLDSPAGSITRLTWQYDPGDPTHATGSLGPADVPTLPNLLPPLADCGGAPQVANGGAIGSAVDPWGLRAVRIEEWSLPTCSGVSQVRREIARIDGLEGVFVDVSATIANPDDVDALRSLALTPLRCPDGIAELTWPTFGGRVRTREIPIGLEAWNPVSADGWVEARCASGERIQLSVDTSLRGSMGMLALRNDAVDGLLAPLGALWGDGPWHDAARTGGLGLSDHVTPLVGSQFTPSAPSFAGQEVRYRLWVTSDAAVEELELFAHPPYVRVAPLP